MKLPPCQHHISITFTSCGMPQRIPTSMLAIPLTCLLVSQPTTPGMSPTPPNTPRGKSTLLLQFSQKNRHQNWRNISNHTPGGSGLSNILAYPWACHRSLKKPTTPVMPTRHGVERRAQARTRSRKPLFLGSNAF